MRKKNRKENGKKQQKPIVTSVPGHEILHFGDRICDFLVSCGGAYKRLTGEIQTNVFHALGSRQFVMKEENGEIVYFVCYWWVQPDDVEGVMERVKPLDITRGSVMYVSEAGNKGGRKAMAEIVKRLRVQAPETAKGLFWHRPEKQDLIYHFPSQQGAFKPGSQLTKSFNRIIDNVWTWPQLP